MNQAMGDLSNIKTAAQKRREAQVATIKTDISRIDDELAHGDETSLKNLHRYLDGMYSRQIRNWGVSTYCYNKTYGYVYDSLGEDALRENLVVIQGMLHGLLFEIDPIANVSAKYVNIKKEDTMIDRKKLLSDYAKIKQSSAANMAINISGNEYPLLKSTLDYLEENEYIRELSIDSGDAHVYIKTEAFDVFTEHMAVMAEEEENKVQQQKRYDSKKVFLVHGHDHALLDEVELMLRRLDLTPIILKNEANSGRTIIEKIEQLTDVGYGIVLYTGCDKGGVKGSDTLQPRARQNVVFEHGYLCAKLGRDRVTALNDDGVEVPSDLAGVLYIPRSDPEWKHKLMKEMKTAGLQFDPMAL